MDSNNSESKNEVNTTPKFSSRKEKKPIRKGMSLQDYIFLQLNPDFNPRKSSFNSANVEQGSVKGGSYHGSICESSGGSLSPSNNIKRHKKKHHSYSSKKLKINKSPPTKKSSKFKTENSNKQNINIYNFSNKKIVLRDDFDRKHCKKFLEEKNKALKPMFLEDEIPKKKQNDNDN